MTPSIQGPLCLFLLFLGLALASQENADLIKLIENFPPANYNKAIRPNYGGPTVNVGVTMYMIDITDVSEKDMQFKTNFYFRHTWNDTRLAFPGNQSLYLNGDQCHKLWTPDTFFPNAKKVRHHSLALTGDQAEFCRVSPDGVVFMSKFMSLTLGCAMNLKFYPFDRQMCTIEIESYGYSASDIFYLFARGPNSVGISSGLELPDFRIQGHKQSTKLEVLSTGNYSRLIVEIQLERASGSYISKIYIPAFLLLVLSWFPLFIGNKPEVRAKLALFMTLAVTFFNVFVSYDLPTTGYCKTVDHYLAITWILVFLTLVETSAVAIFSSKRKYKCFQSGSEDDLKHHSSCVDKIVRLAIPLLGVIFNVIYVIWIKSVTSALAE